MEDEKIIGLYWERNEDAITETSSKYGKLFFRIASNILLNHEDSEECVNDTYFGLWNAIPKERPSPFSVFASRITRNLALKEYYVYNPAIREAIGGDSETLLSGGMLFYILRKAVLFFEMGLSTD